MQVPLGLDHLTFLGLPPLELLHVAARAGFSSLGLRLIAVAPGAEVYDLAPGSAAHRAMRSAMADTGVGVHGIEVAVITPAFDPASLVPALDAGAALGARRLTVNGDDPDPGRLADTLARIADLAAPRGIALDIEPMKWRSVRTLEQAAAAVSGLAGAGVLVDALHLSRTGQTPADVAALPPGLVRAAQICDAAAAPPTTPEATIAEARGGRLVPGEGGLPLAALLEALPPDCLLSVELPLADTLPPDIAARRIFDATRALVGASHFGQMR